MSLFGLTVWAEAPTRTGFSLPQVSEARKVCTETSTVLHSGQELNSEIAGSLGKVITPNDPCHQVGKDIASGPKDKVPNTEVILLPKTVEQTSGSAVCPLNLPWWPGLGTLVPSGPFGG